MRLRIPKVAILCLLLLAAWSYLWWRSYHVPTGIVAAKNDSLVYLRFLDGNVSLGYNGVTSTMPPRSLPFQLQFGWTTVTEGRSPNDWGFGYSPLTSYTNTYIVPITVTYWTLQFPATLGLLLAAWPIVATLLILLRRRKPRTRLACPFCGYDLRGHQQIPSAKCPECGRLANDAPPPFPWKRAALRLANFLSLAALALLLLLWFASRNDTRLLSFSKRSTFALASSQGRFIWLYGERDAAYSYEGEHTIPAGEEWWDQGKPFWWEAEYRPSFRNENEINYLTGPASGRYPGTYFGQYRSLGNPDPTDHHTSFLRAPAWLPCTLLALLPALTTSLWLNKLRRQLRTRRQPHRQTETAPATTNPAISDRKSDFRE